MRWSVGSKVKLGVGITLIVLLVNAFLSYAATRTLIRNDERVRHSYQVISELEATLSTVKDAETGERGYIITGSDTYLEPYDAANAQIVQHIRKLKELTADNPNRRADIPLLEHMIGERLGSLKDGIRLRRNGDLEGARQLILSGVGKRMMDDLRLFINRLETDENQLLAQRTEDSRKSQRDTILTFVIANLVACGILLVTATVTVNGITARQRAEDELRGQRQLLQVTLSSIADAVIACDNEGSITFLNPIAEALTGWSREEAEGQPLSTVFNIVNEQTRRSVANPAIRALREGTIVGLANHTVVITKQGNEIPIDDSASPIKTADGKILGAVLVFRDITARRRAEQERSGLLAETEKARQRAEAASNAKDEFLAVLSHELRTPLTAVVGWMQLLQGSNTNEETRNKAHEVINRNLRVQTQLIDDLLNISQIVAGKLEIRPVIIDPLQVIHRAMDSARPSANAKEITLRLESDEKVPTISADPARLQQIAWNLFSNAIKFTPKGGTIEIKIHRIGTDLQIAVSDTGQGISPEFLPQVFHRFSQADASTTRSHGGLGLGLALVWQLVELHGGTVRAESDGIGKGSKFTVSLPLAGATEEPGKGEISPDGNRLGANLEHVRVLLVEDDDDTREMIAHALRQSGASVVEAASASEGFNQLTSAKPDVLVSDIGMADMDGYQLLMKIRQVQSQALPAIAVTAYANPADKDRALRAGFHAYMAKPIDVMALISTIAGLNGRHS